MTHILRITGKAKVEAFIGDYEAVEVTDALLLNLDGTDCQEDFVDYIRNKEIKDKLTSGYMSFSYEDGKLYTVVEYECSDYLDTAEEAYLVKYTQGQLSDGIGEGFEQSASYEEEGLSAYISPWFMGQNLSVRTLKEGLNPKYSTLYQISHITDVDFEDGE